MTFRRPPGTRFHVASREARFSVRSIAPCFSMRGSCSSENPSPALAGLSEGKVFSPSSHVYSAIFLHFNWHCHDNSPMLTSDKESDTHQFIRDYCERNKGLWFKGIGGIEDHVHLVVQIEPFVTISDFVGKIKGSSSHELNARYGAGSLKWQRGYGVVSFSEKDLPAVLRYVANQREHHRKGTGNAVLENSGYDEGPGPF